MLVASDGTFTPLISCLLPPIEGHYIASCINEDNGQNVKGDDDCDDDGGDDGDDDDDDDDDIYIMMQCVSVTKNDHFQT